MASPSGTYVIMAANQGDGDVTVTINYDPATKVLVNRGNPARCVVADNTTGGAWKCTIRTGQGTFRPAIPRGHTALTASQVSSASGITTVTNLEFSL